ncbi:hypothetical protein [Caballeronia sp. CLC5]|uniref:hypothetical protein n=1 Tax=Caballeronia sp. CLC5 TaxID=2906764 RepID=UPI001F1768BC|nr:hypothetical protein [Caballeronia sp. CLC5]MCE4570462.1 hypothetical protein [Caballeronia sp. CLC5]
MPPPDAAKYEIGLVGKRPERLVLAGEEARNRPDQVCHIVDALLFEGSSADRRDRHRDILEAFFALAGGNDNVERSAR